ncbi:MAG: ribonuclease HII [Leptospiraceae bacterium]|nr:ribonuclease HII [Leptospiraceae bacterium]MDW8307664.1 ribonuclease HII [Leptospiraceae bacterium]
MPHLKLEHALWKKHCGSAQDYALAFDEAGRGPLFGPVTVGAFVIHPKSLETLKLLAKRTPIEDSKKLSPRERESSYQLMQKFLLLWHFHTAVWYINQYNINQAIYYAMARLISKGLRYFQKPPLFLLADGNYRFQFPYPYYAEVRGDTSALSLAAASLAAKVERDKLLMRCAERYAVYGISQNKGYATKFHREALRRHGPTRLHRRAYLRQILDPLILQNRQK